MALWFLTALLAAVSPEPVNKVVAVVEGAPITLWDVEVETRLRLMTQRGEIPQGHLARSERLQSLDQLINQMLAMQAAERFQAPQPSEAEIDFALYELRQTLAIPLRDQLDSVDIPEERMRERVRVKLRIRNLVQYRLRDLVHVSAADVERYKEEHPEAASAATDLIREYLATVKLQERASTFFEGLRARGNVHILDRAYLPEER